MVTAHDSFQLQKHTWDKNKYKKEEIVNEKLKSVKFRGVSWHVNIKPTMPDVQRLNFQAQANAEENVFTVTTDGDALKFKFGDLSSHAGEFTFATGIFLAIVISIAYSLVSPIWTVSDSPDSSGKVVVFKPNGVLVDQEPTLADPEPFEQFLSEIVGEGMPSQRVYEYKFLLKFFLRDVFI